MHTSAIFLFFTLNLCIVHIDIFATVNTIYHIRLILERLLLYDYFISRPVLEIEACLTFLLSEEVVYISLISLEPLSQKREVKQCNRHK